MALLFNDLVKAQTTPQVTRYTNPTPAAPAAPTAAPTPSVPPAMAESIRRAGTPASPTPALQTLDEFSATRGGNIDENAIREQTRKNMQAQVDAVNSYYADLKQKENQAGEARLDKVRAINVNSGLSGSNFATSQDLQQRDKNTAAVRAIEDERNLHVQGVLGKIDEIARAEIAAKKEEAKGNADAYSKYLEQAKADAQPQVTQLAGSGVDLMSIPEQQRKFLLARAYGDEGLGAVMYNSMKPKPQQLNYEYINQADGSILAIAPDPNNPMQFIKQTLQGVGPDIGLVIEMIQKYPDAGILPTDDIATASGKIQSSRIYKDQVRPPVTSTKATTTSPGTTTSGNPTSAPVKLNATQQETINTMDTVSQLADQIIEIGDRTGFAGTGGFYKGSVQQFLAKNLGKGTADEEQLRNLIGNVKATIAKLRGGTSFTESEEKLLESYTPTINDSAIVIKTKIDSLKNYISTLRETTMKNAGGITSNSTDQRVTVVSPDGQVGTIPASQLQEALSAGYKQQ